MGDLDLWDLGDLIQCLVVDCDPDATGFLWNAYVGAGPRRRGVLDEAGDQVRVENGVCLL